MRPLPIYLRDERHPQAQVCAACEVRSGALFGALDAEGLERLHADIAAPELEPDERLYARGEPGLAMYTIRAGLVRFERTTERGDRRIVRLAGRGDLIGQEALLRHPHAEDAVACTRVELCRIPLPVVDGLGAPSALLVELMRRWQRALDESAAWSADLSAGPARRRVLMLLSLLARHADDDGVIWLPRREEMGAMLDMTFETASRMVSQLRREGVVEPLPPRQARLDRMRLAAALQAANA